MFAELKASRKAAYAEKLNVKKESLLNAYNTGYDNGVRVYRDRHKAVDKDMETWEGSPSRFQRTEDQWQEDAAMSYKKTDVVTEHWRDLPGESSLSEIWANIEGITNQEWMLVFVKALAPGSLVALAQVLRARTLDQLKVGVVVPTGGGGGSSQKPDFTDPITGLKTNVPPEPADIAPRVITVTDHAKQPAIDGPKDIWYRAKLDNLFQYADVKTKSHYAVGPTLAAAIGSLVVINQKELGFQIVVGDDS